MAIRGEDGNLYNSQVDADAKMNAIGSSSSGGGITGAGSAVFAGAATLPILIALFLPGLLAKVFDWIVMLLLAIGTAGRVILSLLMGLVFSGIVLYHLQKNFPVFKFFGDIGLVLLFLFSIFVLAVTVWIYCSHYFTLQAMLVKNIETTGKISIFVKPFAIAFYGSVLTLIFYQIFKLPYTVFWISLIASAIFYIYQSFSVRAAAKEEKKSVGLHPKGLIITVIIAGVIPFGFTGIAAKVNADVNASGGFRTFLTEAKDGIIIQEYTGKDGNVVIPDTIKGLPVVGVTRLLSDRSEVIIEQVTFPDTLKLIGSGFSNRHELMLITSIVIPEGVTDIDNRAFSNCKNLTSVTLPKSIKRIGESAFGDCTSLTDVKIPPGCEISYGLYFDPPVYRINDMDKRFSEGQKKTGTTNWFSFRGCSKLSAASRQAIKNSGYKGEF
ncbi:MAG: leucine-rich repeat domain-containing protein [Treponema sp.]|nr:leucine-rich repeat domain-containing protein [Treponema sp.]